MEKEKKKFCVNLPPAYKRIFRYFIDNYKFMRA